MFFLFKQKTAYELRISDRSSDVCSSDLQSDHGSLDVESRPGGPRGPNLLEPGCGHPVGRESVARSSLRGCATTDRGSSAERRVGKECVSTCRSRLSPDH